MAGKTGPAECCGLGGVYGLKAGNPWLLLLLTLTVGPATFIRVCWVSAFIGIGAAIGAPLLPKIDGINCDKNDAITVPPVWS